MGLLSTAGALAATASGAFATGGATVCEPPTSARSARSFAASGGSHESGDFQCPSSWIARTRSEIRTSLAFRARYRAYVRWIFHGLFNDEDRLMVDVMDAPPERLYRPDVTITAWRKLCEHARGEAPAAASIEAQIQELQPTTSAE